MRETSGSIAQLALDGRAKELQGIGKTIEEKIVQIVEQGEIEALTKRKATIPPEVVVFMRLPGLGPKTAARIWRELGVTTLDELKAAAEGERLRALRARREERGEDPQGARVQGGESGRGPATARRRPARGAGRRRRASRPSGGGARLGGRLGAATQGDLSATRHHRDGDGPGGADGLLHRAAVGGRRSWRTATRRRRSSRTTACASTFASCRRSRTATCSSTSPARRSTTSRCARTPCGGDSRSPSTASRRSRRARSSRRRTRTRSTSSWATSRFRPSCARTPASSTPRGVASSRSSWSSAVRGDLHTHTHWSADGKNTLEEMVAAAARARIRVLRGHRPLALPPRRTARARSSRRSRSCARRFAAAILAGVEANIRSNGEVDVSEEELATRLGRRVRPQRAREPPDRAGARGDGEPVRRLHRASHGAAHPHAPRRATSTSSG